MLRTGQLVCLQRHNCYLRCSSASVVVSRKHTIRSAPEPSSTNLLALYVEMYPVIGIYHPWSSRV